MKLCICNLKWARFSQLLQGPSDLTQNISMTLSAAIEPLTHALDHSGAQQQPLLGVCDLSEAFLSNTVHSAPFTGNSRFPFQEVVTRAANTVALSHEL